MLKKYLICAAVLLILGVIHAQEIPFEKRLNEFKYSLHHDLEGLDYQSVQDGHFPEKVQKRISRFLEENKPDILNYRLKILQEIEVKALPVVGKDYQSLMKDENHDELNEIMNMFIKKGNVSCQLLLINPLHVCYFMANIFKARKLGTEEFGAISIKSQFAASRLFSRKISPGKWRLMQDDYYFIIIIDYVPKNGSFSLVEVYQKQ